MAEVILVTGSYDRTLIFWDAYDGVPKYTIEYGDKDKLLINKIESSPDKKYLACGGNVFASFYDIISMKPNPIHVFDGFKNNITGIGFVKDGGYIYSCSEDGFIRIHDIRSNKVSKEIQEKESITCVALHPNESELIFGDQQGNIKVYDFKLNKIRYKTVQQFNYKKKNPCPDVGIRSISISSNASQFVAADSNGYCHQYMTQNMDINQDNIHTRFEGHQDYITKVSISADLRFMASCSADKTTKIWFLNEKYEVPKWEYNKTLFGHARWVWDCAFSCDSEYIITASSDYVAKIWQCESGDVLRNLKGHKLAVNCLTLNDVAQE